MSSRVVSSNMRAPWKVREKLMKRMSRPCGCEVRTPVVLRAVIFRASKLGTSLSALGAAAAAAAEEGAPPAAAEGGTGEDASEPSVVAAVLVPLDESSISSSSSSFSISGSAAAADDPFFFFPCPALAFLAAARACA